MSPRTIVATVSLLAIVVGSYLTWRDLAAGPDFVTSAGAACDPGIEWQDYDLGDCLPAEHHPSFVAGLLPIGLLGLIYARLAMRPGPRSAA
ncbi:hypothetical protein VSH64_25490 [Amycolatopsis rhabdoformis]|uniref:Uncharacterized protein n=1 Tax=Amycolatopsis rhabdoformis TaxID=1448059 RepID=A0ABZ1HV92_9PSEU|nr:hypothetical protein [Amycolatopsis rhabdoformis]WSE26232.1 hypothetical protein VSH64_25490 [Amycolatopsis rhabdoformis]